jgi:spermidine synthase
MTEWVPLYESHADAVKSEIATFMDAFPGGTIWANNEDDHGYDLVALGQPEPSHINVTAIQAKLSEPANAPIVQSLQDVGIGSLLDLFGSYAGNKTDLAPWLANAQINRDRNLRLQYIAGLANNVYENGEIYQQVAALRTFPESLFVASDDWKNALSNYLKLPRAGTP